MTRHNLTRLAVLLLVLLLTGCSGEKPEALVASARGLLAKNDTHAAIIQLRNALQTNPDLAEARFLLGKAELETGDLDGAQKELRRALDLKYPPDDTIPPLAEAMLRSGEFQKVIDEFGKTGAKLPEVPSADLPAPLAAAMQQLGVAKQGTDKSDTVVLTTAEARAALQTTLGEAQLALGNAAAAQGAFAAALAAKADYPPALLGQARLAAGSGDLPAALALVESALAKSPNLTDGWALQGDIQLVQGHQEDALASYRKALDLKPDYLPAHVAIVSLLGQQRKFEDASKQLDAMRKFAPKHPRTLYAQAQLAYSDKRFAAARESVQQLLAVAPDNFAGLLLASAIDFQLKSYGPAEANLLKVLAAEPSQPFARHLLARTYLNTAEPRKALEAFKPMLDKVGDDPNLLSLAGEIYMQNGKLDEAARYFEKAATLDPKSPSRKTILALVNMAHGNNDQAVRELEQAAVDDASARPDFALIALYVRQHQYEKALAAIDVLEKKSPENPLTLSLRGAVLLEKKEMNGARKSLERALEINPAYYPAADSLAGMDLAEKKPDEARKRMEAVLAKDPKQTEALLALAELRRLAGGSADEVTALIGKAVAANPTDVTPRLALMMHYLRTKNPQKAVAAGQEAQGVMPDRPEILEALGRAQQAAGDGQQAIATYGRWARLRSDSPLPWLRIAEAQIAAKKTDAALQSLRKALELKPDMVQAQRTIITLDLAAGHVQEALARAREIQKQRPKEAIGLMFEGDIHASKKRWTQAAAAYRAGLKQVPDSDLIAMRLYGALVAGANTADAERLATAWLKDHPKDKAFRRYVADRAAVRKDFATAQKYYRALLDIDSNDTAVLNNLAWTAGQTKDPKALEYAEKANLLAPNNPATMETLGTLLIEKGDTARGVELLQTASRLAPNALVLRLQLAKGLINANRKSDAKKELEELAKLGDKFPAQAEVTKLMQRL